MEREWTEEELEAERKLQDDCNHEWEGIRQSIPGEPVEYFVVCKHCGAEKQED